MQHEPVSALEEAPKIIRIIVVSENAMARAGITQAICSQSDMQVTGSFDSCRAALNSVMKSPPEAIVVELSPGGGEVLDAITRCVSAFPHIAHIVISQTKDSDLAERTIKAGARAFVYKSVGPNSLATAIRDALNGDLHVCRCIASPMLQKTIYSDNKHKTKHPDLAKLSAREFQVFQLLGAGWDNQKIAERLGISVKTLNVHKEHLKEKMRSNSTISLRQMAIAWQSSQSVR